MIIDYEQLKQQFGGSHPADVAARLERAGVRFILGKSGKPFTTEAALNHSMGIPIGDPLLNKTPDQPLNIKVL